MEQQLVHCTAAAPPLPPSRLSSHLLLSLIYAGLEFAGAALNNLTAAGGADCGSVEADAENCSAAQENAGPVNASSAGEPACLLLQAVAVALPAASKKKACAEAMLVTALKSKALAEPSKELVAETACDDPLDLERGAKIEVHSLMSAAGLLLNGKRGKIGGRLGMKVSGRYPVYIKGEHCYSWKQIKPSNVRSIDDPGRS